MRKYTLLRDVTLNECPWLDHDLKKDTVLYTYGGCTYGVISPSGIAASFDGNTPFFEVPKNSVMELNDRSSDRD